MRRWNLSLYAISSCVTIALLAGCGGAQPPISASGAMVQTSGSASARAGVHPITTSSYRVVHRFSHTRDGGRPAGSLIDVNGTLYGTTQFGGRGACSISGGTGCGTIYQLDPTSGSKKLLYSFRGGSSDGAYPNGSLIDVKGTLYGTTTYGGGGCGNYGCGTVFSVSTTGAETMLHTFANASDGFNPFAGLIDVNGTLYGTTGLSRVSGCPFCGTVYSITTSGSEKVLHNFRGGSDGEYPVAGLIDVKGTLYGTTVGGGPSGNGTVYSITTAGTEKVLYSFGNSPDGARPFAGLIDVSGTLYGTTTAGGISRCVSGNTGCGIVYSVTTTGKEKVLYSFVPTNDGAYYPQASLVDVNGTMYGTTAAGGDDGCEGTSGCGIVYSVTTAGHETALHVFSGGSDGAFPSGAMIDVQGVLYGATGNGGSSNCAFYGRQPLGCGTVFALTP